MNLMKLMGLMSNPAKLQADVQEVAAELAEMRWEGEAASGLVRATVAGSMQLVDLRIDPSVTVAAGDQERLAELIKAAVNEAAEVAKREASAHFFRRLGEKLDLGDLSALAKSLNPPT